MKHLFLSLAMLFSLTEIYAQLSYGNGLTYERDRYSTFATTWGGWAHYWGSTNDTGIKMHIHASDPRMSSTTSQIVFLDSDRNMFIDLYCRSVYQTSDENRKTNIRPLRANKATTFTRTRSASTMSGNMPISDMVSQLNPVKFNWKDETEYERRKLRPVKSEIEEYGFIAQEIEAIIPGAVAFTDEGDRVVNYTALIPILVGAVQELTEKVAELEAEINSLKQ